MTTDTGGPAFPAFKEQSDGMALRDYFAAKAMQGLMASSAEHNHADELIFKVVAMASYKQADAMLKARQA